MTDRGAVEEVWLPVIGRALAHICMRNAEMGEKTIAEKAQFLQGLGLDVNNAAEMLGTTANSVNVLLSRAKNGKKKGSSALLMKLYRYPTAFCGSAFRRH